jgi:recombinational DNA repair protein (RecF pathway)
MPLRLKAIILRRKPAADESLILETLLENGEFCTFKIPGILKSAKRSSFHHAPGSIYEMIFTEAVGMQTIPRSSELAFSPYAESQNYRLLAAVAEVIQCAGFVKPAPENTALFGLMTSALQSLPAATEYGKILDRYYWGFLNFLGLAADPDPDTEYVAYDLQAGFLTRQELAAMPRSDFLLPHPWSGAPARETIRKFLKSL